MRTINTQTITLSNGKKIEVTEDGAGRISLEGLFNGYGEGYDIKEVGQLFIALDEAGFMGTGISLDHGYYGGIDGMYLGIARKPPHPLASKTEPKLTDGMPEPEELANPGY